MELNSKKEEMINVELPKKVHNAILEATKDLSEEERVNFHQVFSKSKNRVQDILREYRYSERDIENISEELFEYYEGKVQNEAGKQRGLASINSSNITKSMAKSEMLKAEEQSTEEKDVALKNAYSNVCMYSGDIVNDSNLEARRNFERASEDLILTELKSEIKRKMNPYDSKVAEEAFSEVSRELSRRLLGELHQTFYDDSSEFTKQVNSKINQYVEEFANEYEKVSKEPSKDDEKKDKNNDFKSSLKDGVKSFEEVMAEYDENNKNEYDKEKSKSKWEEYEKIDRFC